MSDQSQASTRVHIEYSNFVDHHTIHRRSCNQRLGCLTSGRASHSMFSAIGGILKKKRSNYSFDILLDNSNDLLTRIITVKSKKLQTR